MARALIKAMANEELIVSDVSEDKLKDLKDVAKVTIDNKEVVDNSDVIFLCVKPQIMSQVLDGIRDIDSSKIVVSIAAGVRLEKIDLPCKVVRVMPNTPSLVGEMAAGYACSDKVSSSDKKLVDDLLSKAGIAIEMSEDLLDAVTGLSGSGPAFVARIIQGFIEAGVSNGLPEESARKLALKTFIGTAKLLEEMDADKLIEMVTSPNGTTAAGREILDNSDIKKIINDTVTRSTERSKELGK